MLDIDLTHDFPNRAGDFHAVDQRVTAHGPGNQSDVLAIPLHSAGVEAHALVERDVYKRRAALRQFGELKEHRAADITVDKKITAIVVGAGKRRKRDRIHGRRALSSACPDVDRRPWAATL